MAKQIELDMWELSKNPRLRVKKELFTLKKILPDGNSASYAAALGMMNLYGEDIKSKNCLPLNVESLGVGSFSDLISMRDWNFRGVLIHFLLKKKFDIKFIFAALWFVDKMLECVKREENVLVESLVKSHNALEEDSEADEEYFDFRYNWFARPVEYVDHLIGLFKDKSGTGDENQIKILDFLAAIEITKDDIDCEQLNPMQPRNCFPGENFAKEWELPIDISRIFERTREKHSLLFIVTLLAVSLPSFDRKFWDNNQIFHYFAHCYMTNVFLWYREEKTGYYILYRWFLHSSTVDFSKSIHILHNNKGIVHYNLIKELVDLKPILSELFSKFEMHKLMLKFDTFAVSFLEQIDMIRTGVPDKLNNMLECFRSLMELKPRVFPATVRIFDEFTPQKRRLWFSRNREKILEALVEVEQNQRLIYANGEQTFGSCTAQSYGGGALPLNCKSVKTLCLWLLDRFLFSIKIFWVGIGHVEEALLLAIFFRKMDVGLHIFAADINLLLVEKTQDFCNLLGLQNYFTFILDGNIYFTNPSDINGKSIDVMWTAAAWEPSATWKYLTLAKVCKCVKYVLGNRQHFFEHTRHKGVGNFLTRPPLDEIDNGVSLLMNANLNGGGTKRNIYYITRDTLDRFCDVDHVKATYSFLMTSTIRRLCGVEEPVPDTQESKKSGSVKFRGGTELNRHFKTILQHKKSHTFPAPIISAVELSTRSRFYTQTRIHFSESDVVAILKEEELRTEKTESYKNLFFYSRVASDLGNIIGKYCM